MDYNLLKTFSKVSELGSFTQAAKVLNQSKSRVSRAIARLENELGVELVRRTTRKTSLRIL
jgi:LysR family transcriptional regulator for bpeEF and oprC